MAYNDYRLLDAKRHTDHCEGWKKEGWRRDGAEKQTPARNEVSQKAHELKLTPVCTVGAQAQSWDLNIWATLVPFDDFFKCSVTSWLFMPRPKHFDTVWLVKLLKTQRSSVIWINLIPDRRIRENFRTSSAGIYCDVLKRITGDMCMMQTIS